MTLSTGKVELMSCKSCSEQQRVSVTLSQCVSSYLSEVAKMMPTSIVYYTNSQDMCCYWWVKVGHSTLRRNSHTQVISEPVLVTRTCLTPVSKGLPMGKSCQLHQSPHKKRNNCQEAIGHRKPLDILHAPWESAVHEIGFTGFAGSCNTVPHTPVDTDYGLSISMTWQDVFMRKLLTSQLERNCDSA